jgi:hypothetical protein
MKKKKKLKNELLRWMTRTKRAEDFVITVETPSGFIVCKSDVKTLMNQALLDGVYGANSGAPKFGYIIKTAASWKNYHD